jgi:hypothetical protein
LVVHAHIVEVDIDDDGGDNDSGDDIVNGIDIKTDVDIDDERSRAWCGSDGADVWSRVSLGVTGDS